MKIHLIAACGVGMSALAGLLRQAGHTVTGSDENVYPPASTLLEELGVPVASGWDPARLEGMDLIVCGNAVRRTNVEAQAAEASGRKMLSFPAALSELPAQLASAQQRGMDVRMVFLEAKTETLIKRFSATRRRHPLSDGAMTLPECIARERRLLAGLAHQAHCIDTSDLSPNALRAYLSASDYLTNVFLVWKRLRGDYIAVEFQTAICSSYSIGATDGDEGQIPIVIEAVQDLTTGTTKTAVPYRIHTLPAETVVEDLGYGSDS